MKINLLIVLSLFYHLTSAQTLELNQAIQLALANNLELQVSENEALIAQNNNHPGNAGMLPNVSLNINGTPALTNINQKFTNGTIIERNNVFSNALNASLLVAYTLYDGSRMYAAKNRLEFQDEAARLAFEKNVQSTINQVITAYGNILRQKELLLVMSFLESLSSKRLDLIQIRQAAGLANNADLFTAQLDLEARRQAVTNQNALLSNAYITLNALINFKPDSMYQVQSIELTKQPLSLSTLDSTLFKNPDLLMAQARLDIARESQTEIAAARLPLVRLTGAYNYNLSQSQAGFSLYNQGMGPQLGLGISIPIFAGNVNKINYENAKIGVKNSELQLAIIRRDAQAQLYRAWNDYASAQTQIRSDSASLSVSKSYIELMEKRFSEGQCTILELIEAQSVYVETNYRYINNLYIEKLAETQLLLLTGQLVQ
ncbi:MAG: TolC family protein [Bacteroidetes bacterium]|nr:TolC family protein [Bacteroidota bacterium]